MFDRFLWFCSQPIKSLERDEFGASLRLHWQWLKQHLLQRLPDMCLQHMRSVLHTMDALLGYDDAAVSLHRSLLSLRGQPRALRSAEGGHVVGELLSLLGRIELNSSNKNLDHLFLRKVALWSNSGRRICRDVMRIVRETSVDSIRSATSVLDGLKQLCDDYDKIGRAHV